jgi:hypothetical protein
MGTAPVTPRLNHCDFALRQLIDKRHRRRIIGCSTAITSPVKREAVIQARDARAGKAVTVSALVDVSFHLL